MDFNSIYVNFFTHIRVFMGYLCVMIALIYCVFQYVCILEYVTKYVVFKKREIWEFF